MSLIIDYDCMFNDKNGINVEAIIKLLEYMPYYEFIKIHFDEYELFLRSKYYINDTEEFLKLFRNLKQKKLYSTFLIMWFYLEK